MTTEKTETPQKSMMEEIASGAVRAPLALVETAAPRVRMADPMNWTASDLDLIAKTVCPTGIPSGEFKLFIARCQASGMNPLLNEAFCVPRNVNIGTKHAPQWIKQYVFQASEAGMEARADDFPEFRGLRASAVYQKDKIVIDSSTGEVSHQFSPTEDRGRLIGAYAVAYREGRKTPVEYVRLEEYVDATNPQWAMRPATMIVKVARAAALRRAFPNHFGGVYEPAEFAEGADREPTPAQAELANRDTTDKLAERMRATAAAQAAVASRPEPQSAKGATVDVVHKKVEKAPAELRVVSGQAGPATTTADPAVTEAKRLIDRCEALGLEYDGQKLLGDQAYREAMAAEVEKVAKRAAGVISESSMEGAPRAPPVDDGPRMVYGSKKNELIRTLTGPEILENLALGEQKIVSLKEPEKVAKVRACINALKAEEAKRQAKLLGEDPPPREPGSDDDVD